MVHRSKTLKFAGLKAKVLYLKHRLNQQPLIWAITPQCQLARNGNAIAAVKQVWKFQVHPSVCHPHPLVSMVKTKTRILPQSNVLQTSMHSTYEWVVTHWFQKQNRAIETT